MQSKKVFIAFLAPALLAFTVHTAIAADDDGTFTINLQGPDDVVQTSQAPVASSAQATPSNTQNSARNQNTRRRASQNRPNQNRSTNTTRNTQTGSSITTLPAATPQRPVVTNSDPLQTQSEFSVAPQGTYNVGSNDTLWSIATRYMPADRSVNEFQIAASIYRRNPNAFIGGNVNRLRAGRITIPALADMAREDERTGSQLLRQGSINLPSLQAPQRQSQNVATSALTSSAETTTTAGTSNNPKTQSRTNNLPVYQATENLVRNARLERQKELEDQARAQLNLATSGAQRDAEVANDPVTNAAAEASRSANGEQASASNARQESQVNNVNQLENNDSKEQGENDATNNNAKTGDKSALEHVQEPNNQTVELTPHASSKDSQDIDSQALKIMLDGAQKQIDLRMREINSRLMDTIERMQKSNDTVSSSTQEAVANLAKQYDGLIAELQQNVTELKGQVASLSRDMSNMREMLLASDEKIESMQVSLADGKFSNQQDKSNSYRTSYNYLVAGIGCLTLMLLILFLVVRSKSRARSRALQKDLSEIDASAVAHDEELLSSTVGLDENEMQKNWSDALAEVEPESKQDQAKKDTSQAILEKAVKGDTALDSAETDAAVAAGEKITDSQNGDESSSESVNSDAQTQENDSNTANETANETQGNTDTLSTEDAWAAALKEQSEANQEQSEQKDLPQETSSEQSKDDSSNSVESVDNTTSEDKATVASEEIISPESEQKSNAEQNSVDDDLSKYIGASGSEWAQQVKEGEENDPNLQVSNQVSPQTNSISNDEPQLKEQDLADAWAQALAQQNAETKNYDVENEQLSTKQAQGDEEDNPKADASVTSEVSDASENQLTQDSDAEAEDSDTFTQVLNSLHDKEDAEAEEKDETSGESESSVGEEQSSKESTAQNLETNSEPSEDEKSLSQALNTSQYTNDVSNDLDESNTVHDNAENVVQDQVQDYVKDYAKDSSDPDIQKLASHDVMPQDGFVQDDQVYEKVQKQELQDQEDLTPSEMKTDGTEDAGEDTDSDDQASDEVTFAEVLKNLQAQSNEETTDIADHEDQSLITDDERITQAKTEYAVKSEEDEPQQGVDSTETYTKDYSAESSDSSDNDDSEDAQIFAHVRELLSSGENSNEKVSDHENEEQTNDAQNQDDHQTFNDLVKKLSESQDEDAVSKVQNNDEILGKFNADDEMEVANPELSSNADEQQNLDPALEEKEHEDQTQAGVSSDTTSITPTPIDQDSDQAIFSEVLNNLKDQNDEEDQDSYSSSTMADSYDPSWDEEHSANSVSSDEEDHDVQTSAEYVDNDELGSTEFKERPQQVAERLFSADFLAGLPSLDEESQSSEQVESLSPHSFDENTSTTQEQTDRENTSTSDNVTANLADSAQENAQLVPDTQKEKLNDSELKMHDEISSVSQSEPWMKIDDENKHQLQNPNEDVYAGISDLEEKYVQENKNIDEKDLNLEKELDKPQDDSNKADLEHDAVAQASPMQHEDLADGQTQEQQSQDQQSQDLQSQDQQFQSRAQSQVQDKYEQNESIKSQASLEDEDQNSLNILELGAGDQVDFNVENNSEAHTQTDAKESLSTEPLADPKAYEQSQSNGLDKDDVLHDLENKDQAQIEQKVEASTTEDTNTAVNSDLIENAEHELVRPEFVQDTEQGIDSKAQESTANEYLNEENLKEIGTQIATQSDEQSQIQKEQVDVEKKSQAETKDNAQHYSEDESPLLNANDAKWNIPDEQEFGIDNTDENINDVDFKETSALQDRELFSGNEILQSIENEELPPDLPQETDQQQANYSPFTWKVPDEEEFDVTSDLQNEASKSNGEQKTQSTSSAQEYVNSEPRIDFEHRDVEKRDNEQKLEQKQSLEEVIDPDELTAKVTNADIAPVSSDSESTGLQEHDIMNMLSEGLGEKELDDDVGQVDEAVAADVKSELDDDDILRMLSNPQEHSQDEVKQDKDHS